MKYKVLAMMAFAVLLSACGHDEHVRAVDRVDQAAERAAAKAPPAEEIKFDDEGQPTFAEASGASATTDAASTENSESTAADTATDTAADATAKADDTKADDAKTEEKPAN